MFSKVLKASYFLESHKFLNIIRKYCLFHHRIYLFIYLLYFVSSAFNMNLNLKITTQTSKFQKFAITRNLLNIIRYLAPKIISLVHAFVVHRTNMSSLSTVSSTSTHPSITSTQPRANATRRRRDAFDFHSHLYEIRFHRT